MRQETSRVFYLKEEDIGYGIVVDIGRTRQPETIGNGPKV